MHGRLFFIVNFSCPLLQRNFFFIKVDYSVSHHPLDHLVEFFMRKKCLKLFACGGFVCEEMSEYFSSHLSRRTFKLRLLRQWFDSCLLGCCYRGSIVHQRVVSVVGTSFRNTAQCEFFKFFG